MRIRSVAVEEKKRCVPPAIDVMSRKFALDVFKYAPGGLITSTFIRVEVVFPNITPKHIFSNGLTSNCRVEAVAETGRKFSVIGT